MIAIVGGTGALGAQLVRLLGAATQERIRIVSRDPSRAKHLLVEGRIDAVRGDVRDAAALRTAIEGARVVVSAMHGFGVTGGSPATVDAAGNRNLVAAARATGAEHIVLVSGHGASADHPIDLFRAKHAAEQAVRECGTAFTIVRPTAFMETWATLLGAPLRAKGKTVVFGPGTNPINFVSAHDVAQVVVRAVLDPALRGRSIDVAGPENLGFDQLVDTILAGDRCDRSPQAPIAEDHAACRRAAARVEAVRGPSHPRRDRHEHRTDDGGCCLDTLCGADAYDARRRDPPRPRRAQRVFGNAESIAFSITGLANDALNDPISARHEAPIFSAFERVMLDGSTFA